MDSLEQKDAGVGRVRRVGICRVFQTVHLLLLNPAKKEKYSADAYWQHVNYWEGEGPSDLPEKPGLFLICGWDKTIVSVFLSVWSSPIGNSQSVKH